LPPIVAVTAFVVQATVTDVTFAEAVPVPLVTVQVCAGLLGCVRTVTLYAPPLAIDVTNVNFVAAAATVKLSPALFCKTNPVPVSPLIVPPMVKDPLPVPVPPPVVVPPFTPLQDDIKIARHAMLATDKIFGLGFMFFQLLYCLRHGSGRNVVLSRAIYPRPPLRSPGEVALAFLPARIRPQGPAEFGVAV
jgi:hypothetical protein